MIKPKVEMIGKEFGRLKVIRQMEVSTKSDRQAWYLCRCQCGSEIVVRGTSLRNGTTSSCGCLRKEITRERNRNTAEQQYNLVGKRFHRLVVQGLLNSRRSGSRVWRCRCDCGAIHDATTHNLLAGNVKSCGCIPTNEPENLEGNRYGRLTVLEITQERKSNGAAVWRCRCDCGNEAYVSSGNLKRGTTTSCGCVRRDELTGMHFGKLTVLHLGEKSNRGNGSYWVCQCECGQTCEVNASKLKSGYTTSCGCAHSDLVRNLSGEKFGKLTVLCDSGKRRKGSGGVIWTCLCECGQKKDIRQDALLSGATISCGCLKSKGNEKIAKILSEANIDFISEYSPPDMPGNRRFDFAVFCNERLSFLIEYDGVLHTTYSNSGWDTIERFKKTQKSDAEKNEYCRRKSIPLIRIPYTRFDDLTLTDLTLETTPFLKTLAPVP